MPNPTNNKLVDSKTIAALFDMTPRRVQQLTKEGVITAVKEGNANRYDLLPTRSVITASTSSLRCMVPSSSLSWRAAMSALLRLRSASASRRRPSISLSFFDGSRPLALAVRYRMYLLPTIQRYIRYLTATANGREPSKKDSEIEGRRCLPCCA